MASAEPIPGRCGRKANGGYCERYPIKGGTVCPKHGGAAPQAKRAAKKRREQSEALEVAQRMVARAGVDVDPIDHLLDSLHLATALMHVWGAMVADIDRLAAEETQANNVIRGDLSYTEVERDYGTDVVVTPNDRLMAVNSKGEARVHPYMEEYQRAVERRAKFAKLCIDAGIAERQIRVAEQQAQLLANAVRGILADLGVSDHPQAPAIVRKHLMLLAGGQTA